MRKQQKVLPTIGPTSENNSAIKWLTQHYNMLRLNGSHNTLDWHKRTLNKVKEQPFDTCTLLDFPGVKPRTNNSTSIAVYKGEKIIFHDHRAVDVEGIRVTNEIPDIVGSIQTFSVSDGSFHFQYISNGEGWICGKALSSFELLPQKGVNIPNSLYNEEKQLEIYKAFFEKVSDFSFDAVGLSFIQSGQTIQNLRKLYPEKIFIAKVENSAGLDNCKEIAEYADGIMIDRGDLGAEIGDKNLYRAIQDISDATKSAGKFLIMATENLETLVFNSQPTKSEIVSLSHSIAQGTDALMLSAETAMSDKWKDTLLWLDNFIEPHSPIKENYVDPRTNIFSALTPIGHIPTVIFSRSGNALIKFLREHDGEVVLVTDNSRTAKLGSLYHNVSVYKTKSTFDTKSVDYIKKCCKELYELKLLKTDLIQVVWIAFPRPGARFNTISIFSKDDLH